MTNTTPTDPAEQDWLEAFIESWIPIHVKDTLHVKEAKLDARKEFVAAITAHLQAAVEAAKSDLIFDLDEIDNKPWRVFRQLAKIHDGKDDDVAKKYREYETFFANGGMDIIEKELLDLGKDGA